MNHITQEQFVDIIDDLKFNISNAYNITDSLQNDFFTLIKEQPESFFGRTQQKHITTSSLVVDKEHENVLLTHHKKFNQWLALGGHWMDNDNCVENVFNGSLREVFEEAYGNQPVPYKPLNNQLPINLDIHQAGKDIHYDMCFLTQIDKNIPYIISDESHDVQWISISYILDNKELFNQRLVNICETLPAFKENHAQKRKLF